MMLMFNLLYVIPIAFIFSPTKKNKYAMVNADTT